MACDCEATYGRACTGVCTQQIMPTVLEGLCPQCHSRLDANDRGKCPNGHGYWSAAANAKGDGYVEWAFDLDNPLTTERSLHIQSASMPASAELLRLLAGEAP